tara:strand:- start:20044 stop:20916 length:873 start_codon:yes stop_codon:yes gene_type:complete
MKTIITDLGNSTKIAKALARKLGIAYTNTTLSSFPDGDIYLKYNTKLKGNKLIIMQSFQPNSDQSLFDIIFAAETAKDLGAKRVILIAPYLAYMRQDKRFNPGECISSRVMAKLLNNSINKIITIDPHLHRYRSLKDIFKIPTKKLTASTVIAKYLKKNIKNPAIIGPDWESFQWAESIAKQVGCEVTCFKKTRYSSRHVASKMIKPIQIKGKNIIIVDDIISTGHTILEAAKTAKKLGAKSITAICIHGLFMEGAVEKLQKKGIKVISTNTVEHATNKIDVSELISEAL